MIKVHIHSDCSFFAGSERMLALIINNPHYFSDASFTLSFRDTDVYLEGFRDRVRIPVPLHKVRAKIVNALLDNPSAFRSVRLARAMVFAFLQPYIFAVSIAQLTRILRQVRPDIVHVNNGGYPGALSARATVIAASILRIDSIVMVVNNQAVPYTRISRLFEWPLDVVVKRKISKFVTGSKSAMSQLVDVLGIETGKQVVVPNGIEEIVCNESRIEFKRRNNLVGFRGIIFGVVAIHEVRKGHAYLIEAIALLAKRLTKDDQDQFLVLIEGYGLETERLKALVRECGIDSFVRFVGQESEIGNFMGNIDCLILPSIENEDFPNVVLEAMSLGKPVISTNIAGIPEQIEKNVTGMVVEPRNAEALAGAILNVVNSPELLNAMGVAGRQRFEANFSKENALVKYAEMYRSLSEGGL